MELPYQLVKSLLLPPGLLVLVLLLGVLSKRRGLILLGTLLLYLFSTPFVAGQLSRGLEQHPALTAEQVQQSQAEAIVVLTGGRHNAAAEYAGDTVGSATLERLRYAAWLQRRSGLPVIVSGGSPYAAESVGEAELALPVLKELGAATVLVEAASPNTRENARKTLTLLQQQGVSRIFLVTHAWHLPRAMQVFAQHKLEIIPAPTGFYFPASQALQPRWRQWLADAGALQQTRRALHEYLGMLWYAFTD